jgi:hypothetical protein
MKNLLRFEELAQLAAAIFFMCHLPVSLPWWSWPLLFLAPDLSMLGYIPGNKAGAFCYNFIHHKALGLVILLVGLGMTNPWLQLAGLLLFAHSCFDRTLGYGLKLETGFGFTHLGTIGKAAR